MEDILAVVDIIIFHPSGVYPDPSLKKMDLYLHVLPYLDGEPVPSQFLHLEDQSEDTPIMKQGSTHIILDISQYIPKHLDIIGRVSQGPVEVIEHESLVSQKRVKGGAIDLTETVPVDTGEVLDLEFLHKLLADVAQHDLTDNGGDEHLLLHRLLREVPIDLGSIIVGHSQL